MLLGWDSSGTSHDAVGDAVKSIRLFNLYTALQADPAAWQKAQVSGIAKPAAEPTLMICMPVPPQGFVLLAFGCFACDLLPAEGCATQLDFANGMCQAGSEF